MAKRDVLNCYGSNQLSIDELFSPTDWTARPVAALICFPVKWERRVCVWEDAEPLTSEVKETASLSHKGTASVRPFKRRSVFAPVWESIEYTFLEFF